MKPFVIAVLLLLFSCSLHAQTLYVGCKRSIDNARIQADSIRVVCAELGIDSTVRGSEFTLPTTTGVHDDGYTGHGEAIEADLYDVLGRYVGHASMQATANCLQWDATHGLVIVRTLGKHNQRRGQKGDAEILGTRNFTITAWRAGYETATVTRVVKYFDVEVPMVLELLPWWKRIRAIVLHAKVPRAIKRLSWSAGRGGSYRSGYSTETVTHSFTASAEVVSPLSDNALTVWKWNDTSATYFYVDTMPNAQSGPKLEGRMICDTALGLVREIWIKQQYITGTSRSNDEVMVKDLPSWSIQTPGKMAVHMVDQIANGCLVSVTDYGYSIYSDNTGFSDTETTYGPHFPSNQGIEVSCEIQLLE